MNLYVETVQVGASRAVHMIEGANPDAGNYTNRTTELNYWPEYALHKCKDYNQLRSYIQPHLDTKKWTNLNAAEEDAMTTLYLKEDVTSRTDDEAAKRIALINNEASITNDAEARVEMAIRWGVNHTKDVASCMLRHHSDAFHNAISLYLNPDDREDFFVATYLLCVQFSQEGIKGSTYNSVDGIFDWINSTSGYSATGLNNKGYTYYNGGSEANFITALLDVLENGIY